MQASVGQIRTVETTIVVDAVVIVKVVSTIKAIEVPASTNVSAEASVDVALKAATYVVAETATHMTASAAACLGVRRKQAAGHARIITVRLFMTSSFQSNCISEPSEVFRRG
jgi:hypothetical protein